MKKLLIIDSNSIINRAFYGIRHLSNKDGTPTNAIYGFLNILLKLADEQKPDYICAAFDLKAPTFRHEMYSEYKAQRKPMPEDLKAQMPIAKDVLKAMNIKILELEGYEADDIIGTVSKLCEASDVECMIATGDKDDLQLASDKTKVILTVTRSGVNETIIYDNKAVMEKYHVSPSEFIDVKALMGDPSDNIPGVAGIGEKTAMSLIEAHKSIEYIYENIDSIGLKGAMLEKLKNGRDMAFLSKTLATINTKVPIDFNMSECEIQEQNLKAHVSDEFVGILKRLELFSIIKRLDLKEEEKIELNENFFDNIKMFSVQSKNELLPFAKEITEQGEFAFLIKDPQEMGISYSDKSISIALNSETLPLLCPIFEDENIRKTGFNIKNTIVKTNDFLPIKGIDYDVAVAAYLIDPAKNNYDIAELALEYLNVSLESSKEGQLSLFDEPEQDNILSKETACLFALREKTAEIMKKDGQLKLYEEIELPLSEVLAHMQLEGIKIDREQLSDFSDMLSGRIEVITQEIYALSDEEFNINSPKQLGVILFEKLGLKSVKKTKSGYSTNADVLEKLKDKHEIIPLIMEYRTLSKLKSTYCDGLLAVIDPNDGRIHSNFTQTVTVTGRISSTEPNMQNIPVRTPLGREMRKMFVADEGKYLIDADYSQIELRVLSHIAEDEKMISAFKNDEDIHTVTASQVFGIAPDEVTSEQRSKAKAVNFGIVYGIGEYSLSQDIHVSVKEAKQYIQSYLEKYNFGDYSSFYRLYRRTFGISPSEAK